MKRPIRSILILAALSIPTSAFAQYRVDNGQARDANNRLGSGGFNSAAQLNGRINGLAGNYVVTGNVTGGRSFRGSLGYTDPTAFRGSLGSATFDNYLRDSIGASQMRGTAGTGYNFATIQPYFGAGSTVAPPAGFGRDPSTGAYYLPNRSAGVTAGDGRIDFGGASRSDITAGVLSTQRAIGGAGLANSPFANLNQRDQLTNMVRMSDFTTMSRPGVNDAAFGVTDGVVSGPRLPTADMKSAADETGTSDIGIGSDSAKQEETPQSPGLTGQGTVFKNLNAIDNNSQYAELRKRLDEKNAQPKLPKLPNSEAVESANKLNEELRRAKEREAESQKNDTDGVGAQTTPRPPAGAGGANPVIGENAPTNPNLPKDTLNLPRPADTAPPTARPAIPLEINSLATGVKDKDLSKLLSDAEAAMKQGKFSTAIEAYDRAEQIASDDPLVFMGRSIAELGGSYYRSAEIHLRQAFAADNSLLLAKFDLRTMLTDDRLNFLQNDLAQIAKKNEKDPGPLMLLAFIYYSTGFPERSERALEMVQERAGGNDPTAALLKEMWFPGEGGTDAAPTPEMNK